MLARHDVGEALLGELRTQPFRCHTELWWHGLRVELVAPRPEPLDAVAALAGPSPPADDGSTVHVWCLPSLPSGASAAFDALIPDSERIAVFGGADTARRRALGDVVLVETERDGTRVIVHLGRREVVVCQPRPWVLEADTVSVVRGQVLMPWCSATATIVHAGACVLDGRGVLVFGESGDGKTTTLLHLLVHRGAEFLSNDRVVVRAGPGGAVSHGLPYPLTVGRGTAELFPELGPAPDTDVRAKIVVPLDQLSRLYGVRRSAPVGLVVRPLLDRRVGPPSVEPVSAAVVRDELTGNVAAFRQELAPGNWSGLFAGGPASEREAKVIDALSRCVPHHFFLRREHTRGQVAEALEVLARRVATSRV
ncbi:hypothetical protein BU204_18725 [Actinophytocola xanthii]|uniref:HPr kinase/phosphorylase C-terminal domain-containing protein n=2 Tax=Actinophytocola xanthii TaxID=1912961 RepID=A0A1Q8CNJ3_9PSEU|nr:hypothetical protein BU204_18725 [Actinophytocola xanthii]